jgi:hypothetical protein
VVNQAPAKKSSSGYGYGYGYAPLEEPVQVGSGGKRRRR